MGKRPFVGFARGDFITSRRMRNRKRAGGLKIHLEEKRHSTERDRQKQERPTQEAETSKNNNSHTSMDGSRKIYEGGQK